MKKKKREIFNYFFATFFFIFHVQIQWSYDHIVNDSHEIIPIGVLTMYVNGRTTSTVCIYSDSRILADQLEIFKMNFSYFSFTNWMLVKLYI